MPYLPIIGLEIHLRLKTKSKMFCACANVAEDAPPNSSICPVCTGQPGALPTTNAEAVNLGVRMGLALNCAIPNESHFDRKNYFYPDLPKGYQISQWDFPIAQNGVFHFELLNSSTPLLLNSRRIDITRAHLEEDAAKNTHDVKSNATLVDFNRSGAPLLEIVTEPDFRSPAEAKAFLQELQQIARTVGASDADMEKGYMRCDANISLLPIDGNGKPMQEGKNPKTEIKNLNSFRAVERALAFEIKRQTAILDEGVVPTETTRGWDEHRGETFDQRSKESGADYRYFPEPDLPPLHLKNAREVESGLLPELPAAKRARLQNEYGFSTEDARFFVSNDGWMDFVEAVMSELSSFPDALVGIPTSRRDNPQSSSFKLASGWLTSKLAGLLTEQNKTIDQCNITPENFAEFLSLIAAGTIGGANALKLLALMMETGADPSHLLEEHDLGQNDDPALIAEQVSRLIEQNPDQAAQARAGKMNVVMWFVGGVMKATEGKVDPKAVKKEVEKRLGI